MPEGSGAPYQWSPNRHFRRRRSTPSGPSWPAPSSPPSSAARRARKLGEGPGAAGAAGQRCARSAGGRVVAGIAVVLDQGPLPRTAFAKAVRIRAVAGGPVIAEGHGDVVAGE